MTFHRIAFPRRAALVLALAIACTARFAAPTPAQEATPVPAATVLPPDAPAYGVTFAEWHARFWEWGLSLPPDGHPFFDATGTACGHGQSGPVFFLPDSFIPLGPDYLCRVPSGKAIFVSIIHAECSTVEPPPFFGGDEAALRACATAFADTYTTVAISVDGQPLPHPEDYRIGSTLYTVALPASNLLGVPPAVTMGVADGYALILAPLPPGRHQFAFHAELTDGTVFPMSPVTVMVEEPTVLPPGAATPEAATPVALNANHVS